MASSVLITTIRIAPYASCVAGTTNHLAYTQRVLSGCVHIYHSWKLFFYIFLSPCLPRTASSGLGWRRQRDVRRRTFLTRWGGLQCLIWHMCEERESTIFAFVAATFWNEWNEIRPSKNLECSEPCSCVVNACRNVLCDVLCKCESVRERTCRCKWIAEAVPSRTDLCCYHLFQQKILLYSDNSKSGFEK